MNDDPRTLLHDAAPRSAAPDFDRLWDRACRRRRRWYQAGTAASMAAVVGVAVAVVPLTGDGRPGGFDVTDRPMGDCPVTQVEASTLTPPDPYPPQPLVDDGVWYGTERLWTAVVPGSTAPRMSVWWSVDFEGGATEPEPEIEVVYERLDAPDTEPVVVGGPGTNAYDSNGWFMIAGRQPNEPGCWQATATYRDAELSYVYLVDDESHDR